MVGRNSVKDKIIDGVILSILITSGLFCLIPILNTLAISFSSSGAANAGEVFLIPIDFNLNSYRMVIKDKIFFSSFTISIIRVLLGGGLQFLFTFIMAYPLSKNSSEFKARNIYMWYMLFAMIFIPALIPWYLAMKSFGLRDSIWGLILPYIVQTYNIVIVMNYYKSIPKELSEAAEVDGAGPWYILMRIYLPLSKPALATVTLIGVVGHWNSFLDGLVLMKRTSMYPLATYIQTLVAQISFANVSSERLEVLSKISNRTLNASKVFIAMVPILVVYPFVQRYFIGGIMLGSVKE